MTSSPSLLPLPLPLPPSSNPCDYYRSSIPWLFIVPAIGGFLFGYDIGATSYVVSYLATIPSTPRASNSLSLMDAPFKTGWIVSSSSFGALLGTVILMYIDNSDNNDNNEDTNNDNHRENGLNGGNIRKVWLLLKTNIKPRPIGRRTELRYAGIFYFIGGLFEFLSSFSSYCSSSVLSNNLLLPIIILSIGRWIYGIGIGFAMHGGPTYLAEISPSTIRGQLVGGKEIAIVIGILIGYIIGYKFCGVIVIDNVNTNTGNSDNNNGSNSNSNSNSNNSWAYVYAITLFGSILMIGLSYIIPESPRWLVSQQRSKSSSLSVDDDETETETEKERNIISNDEVLQSLQFVWKPIQAKKEYDILMKIRKETKHMNNSNNDKESSSSKVSSLSLSLLNIRYRPALMAGLGLVILQQITGQPSVLSYAAPILSKVPGLSSSSSIVLAIFKVFVTSISVMLVETRGRKTLLLTGCFLMMVSLFILTFAFQEQDEQVQEQEQETNNDEDTTSQSQPQPQLLDIRSYFVLIGMFAYIAGYQIGFGPITWLMISEVYPQSIRTKAVALSVQLNFALNAIVQFIVPILQKKIGLPNLFFIFSLLSGYSIYFIYYKIIETKGLSLEEIEYQFLQSQNNQQQQQQLQTNSRNDHNMTNGNEQQQQQQHRGWDNNNNDEETIQLLHAS